MDLLLLSSVKPDISNHAWCLSCIEVSSVACRCPQKLLSATSTIVPQQNSQHNMASRTTAIQTSGHSVRLFKPLLSCLGQHANSISISTRSTWNAMASRRLGAPHLMLGGRGTANSRPRGPRRLRPRRGGLRAGTAAWPPRDGDRGPGRGLCRTPGDSCRMRTLPPTLRSRSATPRSGVSQQRFAAVCANTVTKLPDSCSRRSLAGSRRALPMPPPRRCGQTKRLSRHAS